jgi:prepilin-type N-terminal cleavage/methylation domain-containing protein
MSTAKAARRGLTLLELVVVMVILAALAGILVPLMPSLARKAHTSSGATNLGEIAKAVQLYATQHGDSYPNRLDSITTGSGAATYIPTSSGAASAEAPTTPLVIDSLSQPEVDALRDTGITHLAPMIEKPTTEPGSWSPTFYPYGASSSVTPTFSAINTSGKIAMLNPAVAAAKLGRPSTGRYAVFGLGKFATVVGEGMNEAPVWYSPVEGNDPASKYCRFGLVFQVSDSAETSFSRAKLVGVVEFGPWGTMTKDDNLSYHYSLK